MEVDAFCRQSSIIIVAGKGGVGKTTVSAALAQMAAAAGLDVLVIALDASGALPALFGHPDLFGYDEVLLYGEPAERGEGGDAGVSATGTQAGGPGAGGPEAGGPAGGGPAGDGKSRPGSVRARVITPDDALLDYLADHGLKRISKRLVNSGAIEVIATAIPGIREILVLGKVKQLERANVADLIVLDAPAAGHTITFLTSALGLVDAARSGPVRAQAQDVVEMLTDPARCQVMLVTLPEETPVNELVETAYRLEEEVGVALAPIVVNGLYPVLDRLADDPAAAAEGAGVVGLTEEDAGRLHEAAEFRISWQAIQAEQVARLASDLPLPQLRVPFLFTAEIGPDEIEQVAGSITAGVRALPVPAESEAEGA
jgi:anion-transporting  ArsA/GET3 family ATPase